MLLAEVILPLAVKSNFTYRVRPEDEGSIAIGKRVLVRFGGNASGGKIYTGVVRHLFERPEAVAHDPRPEGPDNGGWEEEPDPSSRLREIEDVLDELPVLYEAQLEVFRWAAFYYCCTEGEVLKAALPAGLKPESALRVRASASMAAGGEDGDRWHQLALPDKDFLLMEALYIQPVLNFEEVSRIWDVANPMPRLRAMQAKGIVDVFQEVEEAYKPRYKKYLRLADSCMNEPAIHAALDSVEKNPIQETLLLHIVGAYHQQKPVPKDETLKLLNIKAAVVSQLVKKGFLAEEEVQIDRMELYSHGEKLKAFSGTLTEEQQRALNEINTSFAEKTANPVLLHGITGSGKTHIYIELIRAALAKGRQVLYLLPEITLTKQIVDKVKAAFGNKVGIYHSRFNDHERVEIWHKVRNREYDVVVGVRSSIFLPFKDLGLIVVDEEHDGSFKQQEPAPRYNARDLAIYYAYQQGIPVVLGSATPSFESYHNALAGKYTLVELHQRAIAATLPTIQLVDMRNEYKRRTVRGSFSSVLHQAIGDTLARGEQVILFQNRRGYSPYLSCLTCGHVPQCINCDISLTFHKEKNHLRCHYCGYTEYKTTQCSVCDNHTMQPKGMGTEKIEEQVQELFPNHVVGRMDLDTTRTKFGYQQLIAQFEAGEIHILVGTQMVSKGLDFENATLVGVMNADNLLTFPDFRASESAYQLLTQVSGRAGRSTKKGSVIIQTSMTDSMVLQSVEKPFEAFYSAESPNRRPLGYPPFTRVVRIETSHKDRDFTERETQRLDGIMRPHFGSNLLGPDYALVARVRNQYRMQFMLKVSKALPAKELRALLAQCTATYYAQAPVKTLRITTDPDPM